MMLHEGRRQIEIDSFQLFQSFFRDEYYRVNLLLLTLTAEIISVEEKKFHVVQKPFLHIIFILL